MAASDPKLVQAWLRKAMHDLRTAELLSANEDGPLDTAIYHCQQAAEKAVKGFLCYAGIPIEKTHDVERLIKLASQHRSEFSQWLDEAEIVTPYATRFRYPMEDLNAPMEPSSSEFAEALDATQRLYHFVLSVLPPETHPV